MRPRARHRAAARARIGRLRRDDCGCAVLSGALSTNNLWVNLKALKQQMDAHDGVLPLPVIKNGPSRPPACPRP